MDLIWRLIERLRNLMKPPRQAPLAFIAPPTRNSAYDDRFGYAQEMTHGRSRSDRQEDAPRLPEEDSAAPDPQAKPPAKEEVTCESSSSSATDEASAVVPSPSSTSRPSRKQRRATASEYRKLEKARMKFDKWVTPQGTPAEKVQHAAPKKETPKFEPEPEPAEPVKPDWVADDFTIGNAMIVEHYDGNPELPEVLYEESEIYGQFNFRDTILEQLDRYWFYLSRMKLHDPDAYGFYKVYGAQILPYLATDAFGKLKDDKKTRKLVGAALERYLSEIVLPPMFNKTRPAFGCVVYGANPKIESWENESHIRWPRFIYYTKMDKPPPETQLIIGGDTYKVTVWWDSAKRARKWGRPQQFCVFIDRSGQHIQVLRTCKTEMIYLHKKKGLGLFKIPDRHWRIPDDYKDWAAQFGIDAQTHLSHIFCEAVKESEYSHLGDVRVQVHKDDMTAVFGIDSRRLSYFFKDRDYDESGHKSRVFHIVKPHRRADGSYVRMHYRGEKEFTWAGYRVEITVPALDHFMDEDFGVGSADGFWINKNDRKYITEPEVAAKLVGWQHQGRGGYDRRAS